MACEILISWPVIKSALPAVEAQSLKHWTAREIPGECSNIDFMFIVIVTYILTF